MSLIEYHDAIDQIETDIYHTASNSGRIEDFQVIQQRLDLIAELCEEEGRVGKDRYKLYELQALLHYYMGNDEKAIGFIQDAIKCRGEWYPKAGEIEELLLAGKQDVANEQYETMSKSEKRKRLIGLEGWLAWFTVGLFVSLLLTVFNFFANSLDLADISDLNQYQSGLGDTLNSVIMLEDLAVVIYIALVITTLTLLFAKRRLAKSFAIATLIYSGLYGLSTMR